MRVFVAGASGAIGTRLVPQVVYFGPPNFELASAECSRIDSKSSWIRSRAGSSLN
jgi:hypothetical protein